MSIHPAGGLAGASARDQLHVVLSQAPIPVAMFDRDMRYLVTSARWVAMFGGGRGDLTGLVHYDVVDVPERWRRAHQAGLAGQVVTDDDDGYVAPDGTTLRFRWSVHPWHDADGAVGGILLFIEDVTERWVAERERRGSDAWYRALVEASPVAVLVHRGGRIEFANPAAAALFGVARPAELLGRSGFELTDPACHDALRARIAELDAGRVPPRTVFRTLGLDGRSRVVESVAVPFHDDRGAAFQAILRDVTEQHAAEVALRDSEQQLSAIVGSVTDGVLLVEADDRVLLANPAAVSLFGGPLVGGRLSTLIPEAPWGDSLLRLRDLMAPPHRTAAPILVTGLRGDGSPVTIELTASRLEHGGRTLFALVLRDQTERQQAALALALEQERFRQLAESIREVFWLTDVAKQCVLYVNPAYEAIWGRPAAELYASPQSWLAAVHPDDRAAVARAMMRQGLGEYDVEYRILRPDGEVRWIHDRGFPVRSPTGEVTRVAGVAEDVTVRRRIEEHLRQAQKLESVGLLASGLAHDFNNLLTVILSSADLLREGPGLGDTERELVQFVHDAARRGGALTRQLLAFTRQEVVHARTVDLAGVVGDAEGLLGRLLGDDIQVEVRLHPEPQAVFVDPTQWTQVLLNLGVNARDAMPDGGRLRISTRPATPAEVQQLGGTGRFVALVVEDTGTGIPPEVLPRVFEPFFTTKERGKGTGLGLSLVYGAARQAGGEVLVRSVVGAGTTFTVLLPWVPAVAPQRPADAGPPVERGREVVLVVEDDDHVRRVATRVLTGAGYTVLAAANGREALALAEGRADLDLVLTDVVMPLLGGPGLVAELRPTHPGLRVTYTTGYLDEARRAQVGSAPLLPKPYLPATLLRFVRAALDA